MQQIELRRCRLEEPGVHLLRLIQSALLMEGECLLKAPVNVGRNGLGHGCFTSAGDQCPAFIRAHDAFETSGIEVAIPSAANPESDERRPGQKKGGHGYRPPTVSRRADLGVILMCFSSEADVTVIRRSTPRAI